MRFLNVGTARARYQQKLPIDAQRLRYYEAVWCIRFIIYTEVAEGLNVPGVRDSLIRRFNEITGITLKEI